MIRLKLDDHGRFLLPAGVANALAGSELHLASRSQRHLLLFAGETGGSAALAGRLGEMLVAELLSFLNMFRKSGILHFNLPGGVKELVFEQGEIVSASSTFPEEEIGEFLLVQGKLDRDTLLKARQAAAGDSEALRRRLLATGLASPRELWSATSAQIEAIVYQLIPAPEGDFVFFPQSALQADVSPVTLSTQNLIMEGLHRADEYRLFMATLCSLDARPVATGATAADVAPAEERLLALAADGRATVRELIDRSGLAEFAALRHLHRLVEQGLLRIEGEEADALPAELAEILAICNGVLAAFHQRISACNQDYGVELRRFLRDLPQPFGQVLRHATVAADGTIDGARIARNLAVFAPAEQRALLAETMNEVVFMACLAARRDLGVAASERLVQQAQEIGSRIRHLTQTKKEEER